MDRIMRGAEALAHREQKLKRTESNENACRRRDRVLEGRSLASRIGVFSGQSEIMLQNIPEARLRGSP